LNSFEPQQPGYKALRAQLEKLLATDGTSDDRARSSNDLQQVNRGHKALKRTTNSSRINLIIANMERWRWLPRDLGATYVMVNIPDYRLQLVDNGKAKWGTKIVVGKPGDMATPLLSETMKYLTINPTWNVPPSIIRNEYLPALQRDPDALERIGLKVGRNHDGSIRVYQPPGARNALGRIRFNFPNPFLVYQHDTPNKNLFAQSRRALSHGCMRVQNPEQYAEELLAVSQPKEGMTVDHIRNLYGDEERTIRLERPIPVHVTYQTAYVDDTGRLATRDDIYGLDAAILKQLHGPERTVADKPIPRNYESSSKPVMARLPSRSRVAEHDGYDERYDERSDSRNHSSWSYVDNPYYNRSVGTW
jgi:murein L,D-transpeptidase YcbB/YkuD